MLVRKFKPLLEMSDADVVAPAHAWLRYGICAYDVDACAWHGWMLETLCSAPAEKDWSPHDHLLPYAGWSCPRCGGKLLQADVTPVHLSPSPDLFPKSECDVAPARYSDDPWRDQAKEYLALGFVRTRWADRSSEADEWHEHCECCFAAISDDPFDLHEGMTDGRYRWVCLDCWARMERASKR